MTDRRSENVTVLAGDASVPVLLTCEHAGNELPAEYGTLGLDAKDLLTHWAYDLGIADALAAIHGSLGACAVTSHLSRLLVDLNREPTSRQLARESLGTGFPDDPNRPVPGNQDLTVAERRRRLERFYRPFHVAVDQEGDRLVAKHGCRLLIVSLHSFTPRFGREDRAFDLGLLYDDDGRLSGILKELLTARGVRTRLNEPYSGLRGENFSPRVHATALGCRQIEIELNQGELSCATRRGELAEALADALRHVVTHGL